MNSVRLQRWGGAALLLLGLGFTLWQWFGSSGSGRSSLEAAFAMPFFGVMGVSMLLFPVSRRSLLERFGVDRPQSLSHYTWEQKGLLVLAVLGGGANLAAHLMLR